MITHEEMRYEQDRYSFWRGIKCAMLIGSMWVVIGLVAWAVLT